MLFFALTQSGNASGRYEATYSITILAAGHAQLVYLLREAGWTVAEPRILIFGVGGTTFQQTDHTLQQLGVTRKAAQACLLKIHTHSVLWVDKLVKLRRHHTTNNAYNPGVT